MRMWSQSSCGNSSVATGDWTVIGCQTKINPKSRHRQEKFQLRTRFIESCVKKLQMKTAGKV